MTSLLSPLVSAPATHDMPSKSQYRSDVDGLRAIAVLAVIFYHFKIGFIPGGFVGVDIFFVISGYLITKGITQQLAIGRFRLSDFLFRRVRRLIPALLATILISLAMAVVLFTPADLQDMSGSAIYALPGLSNIFFWMNSGYFDSSAAVKPLLHTWSLSVEIQFYILWPLTLWATIKIFRAPLIPIIVFFVAGTASALWYINVDSSGAFFLTPFRINEFLLGAMIVHAEKLRLTQRIADLGYCVGAALILYALASFNSETTLFPGFNALIPAVGASLMIWTGATSRFSKACSVMPAVKIGEISYSLYLVHWPIFVFACYGMIEEASLFDKSAMLAGTFAAAIGLYHLIEKPFRTRHNANINDQQFTLILCAAAAAVIVPAASSWGQGGWAWRIPEAVRDIGKTDKTAASNHVWVKHNQLNKKTGFDSNSPKDKLLIIGDSQAADLVNMLDESGQLDKYDVVSKVVITNCATVGIEAPLADHYLTQLNPLTSKDPAVAKLCKIQMNRVNNELLLSKADKIYIAMQWRDFAEPYYITAISHIAKNSPAQVYVFGRKDLKKSSIDITTKLGRLANLEKYASRYRNEEALQANSALAKVPGVTFIDMLKLTCPTEDSCRVLDSNKKPLFFDSSHLTREGAIVFGGLLKKQLENSN